MKSTEGQRKNQPMWMKSMDVSKSNYRRHVNNKLNEINDGYNDYLREQATSRLGSPVADLREQLSMSHIEEKGVFD